MNIFCEYEGIIGKAESVNLKRAFEEFFELSDTIRKKLGKKRYLLEKYISLLLEAANATSAFDTVDSGLPVNFIQFVVRSLMVLTTS